MKIMIVEDDFIIRLFIERVIVDAGYGVVAKAATYQDAVDFALKTHPDLILMDIGLSEKRDGIDAAVAIVSQITTNIIYLTGNSDDRTLERAMATKPLGIINKPINDLQLLEKLQNIADLIHK